jgi:aminopeptidase N
MVQEHEYGRDKMRKFLKYELDRYLSDRGAELVEELPLFRVENQPYIHYRKGSLTFYRLREEIGEEALNRALAKFLKNKAFAPPPYPTSKELLAYIRAESPADKQDLITDLFENITFYDNRVVDASASKRADGKYDVSLTLHAEKKYDDEIEIGVFARGKSGKEADEKPLLLERHRLTEREPKLSLVVDAEPYEVGIDPYNKLIDRVSNDNRKRVTMK